MSAGHAKSYFNAALSKSDYYINDQELAGRIYGRLAERFKIAAIATKEVFFSLCENRDPGTGEPLTPRTKAERTVGYDINFHCPKSVSVVHALSADKHIMDAFEASVLDTMKEIERDGQTRVRKEGKYFDRGTDEMVWAEFTHQTSRPVDGEAPDPHLHAHCFVFNVTWDNAEKRCKAGQFRDIKRDMPYYQAMFHKKLSDRLIDLGYGVRRTAKSFEIMGVPQPVIDLFSKRTNEIGQFAKDHGITGDKELSELGARTRAKKQPGMAMTELKTIWRKQIEALKVDAIEDGTQSVRYAKRSLEPQMTPQQCVNHALDHAFERASVMQDRRMLATVFRQAMGETSITTDQVIKAFNADTRIIKVNENGKIMCTTRDVLREEKRMVDLGRSGIGEMRALYAESPEIELEGKQLMAVRHVLTTRNRVAIIKGAAGTGKTKLLKEAVKHINEKDKEVIIVAPTAEASKGVLVADGFKDATTVAKLLTDGEMQIRLRDQVLWVDEAGLLGIQDMTAILEIVKAQNARLILGGDTRQHSSVVRGDALRILNTVGRITAAEVTKIRRQVTQYYRSAVEDLSKGDVASAFERLDSMSAIQQIDPMKPHEELVDDYVAYLKAGKTALIVSPTHKHGDEVTEAIRQKMKSVGLLGKKEAIIVRLNNLNLTAAQKSDWRNFSEGQIIQFNQNVKNIKRGAQWMVSKADEKHVEIINEQGAKSNLPKKNSNAYDILEMAPLRLSKGDKIKITRNGFDTKKNRLNNGQTLEIVSVNAAGKIKMRNTLSKNIYEIDSKFGHLAHAHCITSYAAQGKTVDHVLVAQPAATFPATNAKQFYVSVSRGRESVRIYTDDKAALLDHAQRMGDRQSALELIGHDVHEDFVIDKVRLEASKEMGMPKSNRFHDMAKTIERDYEPGF